MKIWYSYWLGFAVQEDRRGQVGDGLEDDPLAVGTEVALSRPEEAVGDLPDVLEMLGLELGDLFLRERPLGATRGRLACERRGEDQGRGRQAKGHRSDSV